MVEPRADAAAAHSLAATGALPAPNQGTTASARKRKTPATEKAPRKPRKRQVEEPIQIPVYYGCRKEDFFSVHGDDLVEDCPAIYAENICAHIIGELPLQPQSMSLVDLQLWVFRLFRLHPETQDLHIKGFLKQHKSDSYDEEDPDWYLEYYPWEEHEFYTDKYWRSFANKLKKKRNVTQKFMLYVESSEIRHYDILLKAVNDDYSQQVPVVLPGTESLASCEFRFRYLKEHMAVTAEEMAVYLTGHLAEDFYAHFGDKNLVVMFKKLCQQKRQHKFDKLWKELDELTSKYMAEKEYGASEEVQQGSVKHDEAELEEQSPSSQPDSVEDGKEGDHADNSKGKIAKFSDWIRLKPMEKWSLVHDRNGARYGIMGTDITDVHKNDPVLKGITCLPLGAMVEVTFLRLEEYFKSTSAAANKAIGNPSVSFPERVQDDMNSQMQKAEMHQVLGAEEALKFTVKSRQKQVTVHMKSEYTHNMDKSKGSTVRKTATCSCNKPQLLHKPCSHVIAVCCHIGVSTALYISPYYSLTCLGRTWSKKFNEFPRNYRKILPRYYRDIRPFERETPTWIPDKRLERGFPVYLLSDCVQTAVVDEEQQCTTEDESVADNESTKARSEESRT